jgi:hypothetical protein
MADQSDYSPRGRLVIFESPNPIDLLQRRSEAQTLAAACELVGFEAVSFTIRSAQEFADSCRYIATIGDHSPTGSTVPLFLHISCHGDADGLRFGMDDRSWDQIAEDIQSLCRLPYYAGPCVLSISACGAGKHTLPNELSAALRKRPNFKPPVYLFVTNDDEVAWDDATVAWVILYYRLGEIGLDKRDPIQKGLRAIKEITGLSLAYWRWDRAAKNYRRFVGAPTN